MQPILLSPIECIILDLIPNFIRTIKTPVAAKMQKPPSLNKLYFQVKLIHNVIEQNNLIIDENL